MCWKEWLITMSPKNWSRQQKLEFINLDCPEVTLEDIADTYDNHQRLIMSRTKVERV